IDGRMHLGTAGEFGQVCPADTGQIPFPLTVDVKDRCDILGLFGGLIGGISLLAQACQGEQQGPRPCLRGLERQVPTLHGPRHIAPVL
ncbi:MAG: hypothetical protein NZ703_05645, partial [Gemmataceae bacterium]|nr:hypothetical protein [Gemmataceae bacterium]